RPTLWRQSVSSASSCWGRSRSSRSALLTRRAASTYSTSRARRLVAYLSPLPRKPLTPTLSSFSHTLSSLRLKRVTVHLRRLAASAELGTDDIPAPSRRSIGSASATNNKCWLGVKLTVPTVVVP